MGALGAACAKQDGSGGGGGMTGTGGKAAGGSAGSGGTASGAAGTTGAGGGLTGSGGIGSGGTGVGTGGTSVTGTAGRGSGGSGTAGRGAGGTSAAGGTTGVAGSTGAGGTGTTASCTFTATSSISTKIPTVGIVTWTTTLGSPTAAHIDFGLDTTYGMTAPVDLTQTGYRTLLLGMKASKTYHFRVTASNASGSCVGTDNMITTGALPNGLLPKLTITTNNKAALYGGFLMTGQYVMAPAALGDPAYIIDGDGDFVWWYSVPSSDATGVRMSYDGNYMWINNANVPNGTTHAHRVTMDGMTDTDFSTPFKGLSHQITPLPDGSVAFYAYGTNGCDDIKLFPANGTATSAANTLTNAKTAHGGTGACHVNNIEYSPMDDTLVFSDLDNDCITKIKKSDGSKVWVLNSGGAGITSSFTGDTWKGGEHGLHVLGLDDFIIFNNNSLMAAGGTASLGGDGSGSIAIEMKLNLTSMTATKSWSYKASPGIPVDVMGDIQRLDNGNTIIGYSTKGELQEVDASGTLLQDIKWSSNSGTSFGYLVKRKTLYGSSPK